MARRLNWEKANSRDKAEKPHDLEHVTIAGAPDVDTIFGRKPTFMDRSGLTAKQRKKKDSAKPKRWRARYGNYLWAKTNIYGALWPNG